MVRVAVPSSYKSKLGLQGGLDLARKLEIPILALILILLDGIMRSRGTPCGRTINKVCSFEFIPARSREGTCGRASAGRVHPEKLPGIREVARGDRLEDNSITPAVAFWRDKLLLPRLPKAIARDGTGPAISADPIIPRRSTSCF
ncbi:hypothetical protein PIB30_075977 [Stylosanthes scabra]|uniref:Uncharacterized protein n=1 Tax=Stylosanthes scabra TaxID=79078 RepID=A0ABU6RPZ6_9FABA|nr:hypothetical protein [Stylosanthes scabra]